MSEPLAANGASPLSPDSTQDARRFSHALVELAREASIHSGDFDEALRSIVEKSAHTLNVAQVGVWLYTPNGRAIECVDLYDLASGTHERGTVLFADDHPAYFRALETERCIAAPDARNDPRTLSFLETYLLPQGVTSMLDAPIRRLGRPWGIVCHEHRGALRQWTLEEENFASSVADLVAMAMDARVRREAQESLQQRLDFERLVAGISTQFVNLAPNEVDEGIHDALERIGRFLDADRCHVVLLDPGNHTGTLTHEWCAPGVPSRRAEMTHISADIFPWWMKKLRAFEDILLRSLDDLPPEAVVERKTLERHGVTANVVSPIVLNRTLFGYVGVHSMRPEVTWGEEVVTLLHLVGEIFVSAIERSRTHHVLQNSERLHRLLFERNLAGVYRGTLGGTILDCNDALARMLGYTSRDELIGRKAQELYANPADRDAFIETLQRQRSMTSVELCLRHRDGAPVWLIESVHLIDGDGDHPVLEGTLIDITDRKEAERALRDSEQRYRLMAENTTDVISRTTTDGRILYASDAIRRMLGYEPSEIVGWSALDLLVEADRIIARREYEELLNRGGISTYTCRARRRDGRMIWMETTSRVIHSPGPTAAMEILSVSRDVSERKRVEEQIEYQAYHDALTGLPNRRLFRDRLTVALAHAKRIQKPLAVMFLDLDRFKDVNDTLGHTVGDELLKIIADRLTTALREEDTVARMGGDEFTVLIGELNSTDDITRIAQKLLDVISFPAMVEQHELFPSTSIGIALYPDDGDTTEALLKNADHAMYRAKEAGPNSYQLCTATLNRRAAERLSWESSLRRALERAEFVLHYQPQYCIRTRRIVGMEALLRWQHPQHGLVPPSTFIPIAEDTRLILPIGEWVLRTACFQAVSWQKQGMENLRISVNLSARQFQQVDLRRAIGSAIGDSGLDPRFLELEITESTAMMHTERTFAILRDLRALGVGIAFDDFGTGHSALNYLRHFSIDCVKIDQTFVHEVESSQSDRAIIAAMIHMAHGLGLRVVAEGVETEAQLDFLAEHRCQEVQGHLFSAADTPDRLSLN